MLDHQSDIPKFTQLKQFIKQEILNGSIKPGDKIYSEYQLAEMFSISRGTIRRAIADLVKEGWLYTEHGKGTFYMLRNNKNKSSRHIVVLTTYITEYIFPLIIHGIDQILSQRGYSIILKSTNGQVEKEAACLEEILTMNVAGVIAEPTKSALFSPNTHYYTALERQGVPYLFIHGYYKDLDSSYLIMDDQSGGYLATKHLVDLGHRDIIGVFKADDIQGVNRHIGYANALKEGGISYDPARVIWSHSEEMRTNSRVMMSKLWRNFSIVPEAIVCYNDHMALGVIEHLRELGLRVPEDVSVTGYDNSSMAENAPAKLTSVDHPKNKLGEEAASMILELVENSDQPRPSRRVIQPSLVVRDSTRMK